MTTMYRIFILGIIPVFALSACNLFGNPPSVSDPALQPTPLPTPIPGLGLTVTTQAPVPLNTVGQGINYSYLIGNTSGASIPGPVSVTDDKVAVTCTEITTVGNQDNNLDPDESITCTGTYSLAQADLDAGSATNISAANAGGNISASIVTSLAVEQTRALTLTKVADPQSFNSAGLTIIYSYVITNSGNVTLGPALFTINDDRIGSTINCGSEGTILAPTQTVSCSASYITTEADLTAGLVVNSATASDGTTVSQPVTATINRGNNPANLPSGTTINHQVVGGEWLWQIARCYGADPKQVVLANPQLSDPAKIPPGITVTVPNIGAGGRTIYGPPCVGTHTVQSGETWTSIAALYNADALVLQEVNPGALSPGRVLKVPLNSAGGS